MYALLHGKTRQGISQLEDPIEYRFDSIIQGRVNTSGLHFPGSQIDSRQDPDVIMVGEMRDAGRGVTSAALTATWYFFSTHQQRD